VIVVEIVTSIVSESWAVMAEMSPYLLFGFAMAGLLSVLISAEIVERHLGGRGIVPVLKAALFGVPLPLCSCGVIPVAMSLRRHGATRGATTSFLLSTPQTGVDSIMVTFSLLGWVFAVFRPLVALVTGLAGGSVVTMFGGNGAGEQTTEPACQDACCTDDTRGGKFRHAVRYAFVTLPRDIGKPLLVGLALVGVISTFVPKDFFAGALGTGLGGMFVMMILGIPVYVCATASVPIAVALIAKGVSPGAALVFLMTGPATNAATIAVIWRMMGRRTVTVYLATVAVGALAAGFALDYVFKVTGTVATPAMPWMIPEFVKTAAAIVLLTILIAALVRPTAGIAVSETPDESGERVTFSVDGMTCNHCAMSVERALAECTGVSSANVDLRLGSAVVTGTDFDIGSLSRAIEGLGYRVAVDQGER